MVAGQHLWTYQLEHTWQSYQNTLRITYGEYPEDINTEQELRRQQNVVVHKRRVSHRRNRSAKILEHYNRGLNGGHQDKELTAGQHQGFSRQHQNIALEDFNLGTVTLQEVLNKYNESMNHPPPPLQTAPHNIRNDNRHLPRDLPAEPSQLG